MTKPALPTQNAEAATALPALPEPTKREQATIDQVRQKLETKPLPPQVSVHLSADGQPCFDASHRDGRGWMTHLKGTVGSNSSDYALGIIQFLTSLLEHDVSAEDKAAAVNSMLAVISGVAPHNEVEGLLAVQMAASHQLAMTLLTRVGRAEHIPVLETNGNMALKLLRISREYAEALAKLRRGGNQTVRVEHVHVHSGGQAIVGSVAHPGGRGSDSKTDDQPHAPGVENADTRFLTIEPVAALRSKDPEREPVPVPRGEGADEVPDARRREG